MTIFEEQLEYQLANFKPPHPEHAMVNEALLRDETTKTRTANGITSNEHIDGRVIQVVNSDL